MEKFTDNNDFDNIYDNVPEIRYVNEYRKLGDIFSFRRIGERSMLERLLLQSFVSLAAILLLILASSINTVPTNYITSGAKSAVTWDISFSSVIDTFSEFKEVIPKARKTFGLEENTSEKGLIMPVEGIITSGFGVRIHPVFNTEKMHNGIDIDAQIGTPIKAAASGKVIEIGEDEINGKYIKIENSKYRTVYAHCHRILVKEGSSIKQGDIIAEVGDTGLVSGPHLHFEIWKNDTPLDPVEVIDTSIDKEDAFKTLS
ncbi:MAG: M23 family metallopeptidase [Bacillota bacterium]